MPLKKKVAKSAVKKPTARRVVKKSEVKIKKTPIGRKTTIKKNKIAAPEIPAAVVEEKIVVEKATPQKYYNPIIAKLEERGYFQLPVGYGDNRIVLMVRDPYWLYTYWEISEKRRAEIKSELGEEVFSQAKQCLRVYDTDNWQYFDIEIHNGLNWYIKVPVPSRTYCADIGFLTPDGKFIAAARSNWVTTPLDRMSDVIDEQWMIPDWDTLYALSGGFSIGKSGSEGITELMKKRFQEEASSGWLSSMGGSIMKKKQAAARPFWLVANCELIVYGATEPTATVTVQGRKIKLREDGTFNMRFSLPDGKQVIPIEAIRDDGAERRKITPKVERQTE